MKKYKLIIFDLDGTLTESKSAIDKEMVDLLVFLMQKTMLVVVSGGGIEQFDKQFVTKLPKGVNFENLILFPTNATKMYKFSNRGLDMLYCEELDKEIKGKISDAFREASDGFNIPWGKSYGEIIEDRGGQITFSALGQEAPLELKKRWDSDLRKRTIIAMRLKRLLAGCDLSISIGGTTSIDVSVKDRNKAYAVRKLEDLGYVKADMLFVGDALFEGGNDYPVLATGVECRSIRGVEDTKCVVRELLE